MRSKSFEEQIKTRNLMLMLGNIFSTILLFNVMQRFFFTSSSAVGIQNIRCIIFTIERNYQATLSGSLRIRIPAEANFFFFFTCSCSRLLLLFQTSCSFCAPQIPQLVWVKKVLRCLLLRLVMCSGCVRLC